MIRRSIPAMLAVAIVIASGSGCRTPSATTAPAPSFVERVSTGFHAATAKVWPGDGDAEEAKPLDAANDVLNLANMPAQPSPRLLTAAAAFQQTQGHNEEAHATYLEALQVDPAYLDAHLGIARLRMNQGQIALALQQYEQALKYHPDDGRLNNDLGLALLENRELERAAEHLQRAVTARPGEPKYRNNLARTLVQLGRVDEAQATLSESVGPAADYYNVAYLLAENGRHAAALPLLRKSLELNPELQPARDMMQQLAALDSSAQPGNTSWQ